MHLDGYQQAAKETAIYPCGAKSEGLSYVTLGLVGEAGEISNKVKKVLRDDEGIVTSDRRNAIAKELGDVLWYAAAIATELGCPLGWIAAQNLDRLAARQKAGTIQGSGDNR